MSHLSPASLLPEMTAQEASWHEHLAGVRASEDARAEGSNPAAVTAFASATAGPVILAGRSLQPASQGTLWTLQRVAREFARWADENNYTASADPDAPGTRELIELGLATLVFCDARHVWRQLDAGRHADLFASAEEMMWAMPLPEQLQLQAHFRAQMDAISALSGGSEEDTPEKKLPQAASPLPAMPTLLPVPASPPSNGCQLSMESPFPTQSGRHRWP